MDRLPLDEMCLSLQAIMMMILMQMTVARDREADAGVAFVWAIVAQRSLWHCGLVDKQQPSVKQKSVLDV